MKVLITGGAGYIGSHVADEFLAHGKDVVIYDSLYQGLESRIEYLCRKHNKDARACITSGNQELYLLVHRSCLWFARSFKPHQGR